MLPPKVFTCLRSELKRIYLPIITKVKFVTAVKFHYRVLQLANCSFSDNLTPLGVTFILLSMVLPRHVYTEVNELEQKAINYRLENLTILAHKNGYSRISKYMKHFLLHGTTNYITKHFKRTRVLETFQKVYYLKLDVWFKLSRVTNKYPQNTSLLAK